VLVVGVCSSGKSTLVRKLNEAGYDARACAQEHSYVPHLWQLSNPGALVYLDASLHTIRQRRKAKWQQPMLDEEHRRLAHAREHCDLYIATDGLLPEDVAARVVTYLHARKTDGASPPQPVSHNP
jgi:shikimate kinase